MPDSLKREWSDDPRLAGARVEVYRRVEHVRLFMFIFEPRFDDRTSRPAIVFFHGGGWQSGSPAQFGKHCKYLASRGMVAMSAEYRVRDRHDVAIPDCITDARSAIRWARVNASRLDIDPQRVAAGGGSAGGHLAACTALLDPFNDRNDAPSVSPTPDALVMFNPVLSLRKWVRSDEEARAISPLAHVRACAPPTIIFHGTADQVVPIAQAEQFTSLMHEAGSRCELVSFEGAGHGFFNFARDPKGAFRDTVRAVDRFLTSLGWLEGKPTI